MIDYNNVISVRAEDKVIHQHEFQTLKLLFIPLVTSYIYNNRHKCKSIYDSYTYLATNYTITNTTNLFHTNK